MHSLYLRTNVSSDKWPSRPAEAVSPLTCIHNLFGWSLFWSKGYRDEIPMLFLRFSGQIPRKYIKLRWNRFVTYFPFHCSFSHRDVWANGSVRRQPEYEVSVLTRLGAGWFGVWMPAEARVFFSTQIQTGSNAYSSSYSMCTRLFPLGVKRQGREVGSLILN